MVIVRCSVAMLMSLSTVINPVIDTNSLSAGSPIDSYTSRPAGTNNNYLHRHANNHRPLSGPLNVNEINREARSRYSILYCGIWPTIIATSTNSLGPGLISTTPAPVSRYMACIGREGEDIDGNHLEKKKLFSIYTAATLALSPEIFNTSCLWGP